jgi:DNA replication protein DnaC
MKRKQEYTSNLNIEQLMKELKEMCDFRENEKTDEVSDGLQPTRKIQDDNTDDIYEIKSSNNISVVKKREGVMPKEKYNEIMRKLNRGQKKLIYQYIKKLRMHDAEPIQIALSGPAGSGKTFLIIM